SGGLRWRLSVPSPAASEWPWPGRSMHTTGRSSASATVSHVCAFCAPPCSSASSGARLPHTSALSRRPSPRSVDARRTAGGPAHGMPNSSAFSRNSPNSSYGIIGGQHAMAHPDPLDCSPFEGGMSLFEGEVEGERRGEKGSEGEKGERRGKNGGVGSREAPGRRVRAAGDGAGHAPHDRSFR